MKCETNDSGTWEGRVSCARVFRSSWRTKRDVLRRDISIFLPLPLFIRHVWPRSNSVSVNIGVTESRISLSQPLAVLHEPLIDSLESTTEKQHTSCKDQTWMSPHGEEPDDRRCNPRVREYSTAPWAMIPALRLAGFRRLLRGHYRTKNA